MTNIETLSGVLAEWLGKVAVSVLPSVRISPTSGIGRMMSGFFGIDLSTYNVYDELGFLVTPTIQRFVAPMLQKYLAVFPDEEVPKIAMQYADLLAQRAAERGSVNVFGVHLGAPTFDRLKELLVAKFNNNGCERYDSPIQRTVRDDGFVG